MTVVTEIEIETHPLTDKSSTKMASKTHLEEVVTITIQKWKFLLTKDMNTSGSIFHHTQILCHRINIIIEGKLKTEIAEISTETTKATAETVSQGNIRIQVLSTSPKLVQIATDKVGSEAGVLNATVVKVKETATKTGKKALAIHENIEYV